MFLTEYGVAAVRRFIGSRGWSQEELAGSLGVNKVTVSKWLNGKRRLGAAKFRKLYVLLKRWDASISVGAMASEVHDVDGFRNSSELRQFLNELIAQRFGDSLTFRQSLVRGSRVQVQELLDGRGEVWPFEILFAVCDVLGLDPAELPDESQPPAGQSGSRLPTEGVIPCYQSSRVRGYGSDGFVECIGEPSSYLSASGSCESRLGVIIEGDSLDPTYRPGDICVLDTSVSVAAGQRAVLYAGGDVLVALVEEIREDEVVCMPLHSGPAILVRSSKGEWCFAEVFHAGGSLSGRIEIAPGAVVSAGCGTHRANSGPGAGAACFSLRDGQHLLVEGVGGARNAFVGARPVVWIGRCVALFEIALVGYLAGRRILNEAMWPLYSLFPRDGDWVSWLLQNSAFIIILLGLAVPLVLAQKIEDELALQE